MLGLFQRKIYSNSLLTLSCRNMSYLKEFHRKTNVYDKFQYNPNHISYDEVYNLRKRKPRLKAWDEEDPNYKFAIQPPTKHVGKTLIRHLEKAELDKINDERLFTIPKIRPGDIVEVARYISLSEKKYNIFRGMVTGIYRPNHQFYSIDLVCYFCGVLTKQNIKLNSPLIAKIDIVKYASNGIRNKINHVWEDEWSKKKVEQPIIKGRGYTLRGRKAKTQRRNVLGSFEDPLLEAKRTKDTLKWKSMVMDDTK